MFNKELVLIGNIPHHTFEPLCQRIKSWHSENFNQSDECLLSINQSMPQHESQLKNGKALVWFDVDIIINFYTEQAFNLFKLIFAGEYEIWICPGPLSVWPAAAGPDHGVIRC